MNDTPQNPMTPIAGYRPQSDETIAAVNANKAEEERILRRLDYLRDHTGRGIDIRWLSIARTHFEQAYMALNRAIMKPQRINIDEDIPSSKMPPTTTGA